MKNQNGFTLVEVMIASVIGMFLVAGIINLFITTNKSITLNDAVSQNQETGRFAMEYLTRFIRAAGYTDDFTAPIPYLMLPYTSERITINCNGVQAEACAMDNPGQRGDRLSIPFVANAEIETRSCTGTIVGGPANGRQLLSNVFWVSEDNDTDRELRCRTFDLRNNEWLDNAVSIINNVETMEFQIGVVPADQRSRKSAASYISLSSTDESSLPLIRSMRVSILTTSIDTEEENKLKTNVETRVYGILDAPHISITDGHLRNIFSSTVELVNAIETASENF